jgi:SAM-dependent methyltransferase
VTYRIGAADELDYPSAEFDLVLSVTVLQHITAINQLHASLRNIRRMLRPDGRLVVIEYAPRDYKPRRETASYMTYRTRSAWLALLAEHGFTATGETSVRLLPHRGYTALMRLAGGLRLQHASTEASAGRPASMVLSAFHWLDSVLVTNPLTARFSDVRAFNLRPDSPRQAVNGP